MKKIIAVAMVASPMFAFAAFEQIAILVGNIGDIVNTLTGIMMALAVLVFFWGLVKYIANASDEAAKEGGKTLMIWGLIALFVMVALWAILGFVSDQLGISGTIDTGTAPVVQIPTTQAP